MVCAALLAVFRDAFANRLPMSSALTTLTHPQEDLPGKKQQATLINTLRPKQKQIHCKLSNSKVNHTY